MLVLSKKFLYFSVYSFSLIYNCSNLKKQTKQTNTKPNKHKNPNNFEKNLLVDRDLSSDRSIGFPLFYFKFDATGSCHRFTFYVYKYFKMKLVFIHKCAFLDHKQNTCQSYQFLESHHKTYLYIFIKEHLPKICHVINEENNKMYSSYKLIFGLYRVFFMFNNPFFEHLSLLFVFSLSPEIFGIHFPKGIFFSFFFWNRVPHESVAYISLLDVCIYISLCKGTVNSLIK